MAVTFIDDVAAGQYVSKVNKAVVGADRICSDGAVVNSAGTYQLALAVERAAVPFYVLGEMLKFDPRLEGGEVDLEEKEPSELIAPEKLPPGVTIRNPYFDITPPELVTAVITEEGRLTMKQVLHYLSGRAN